MASSISIRSLKQAAIRIDHGTAQLVQQEPGMSCKLPSPSWAWRPCRAEISFGVAASRCRTAMNQVFRGKWLRCMPCACGHQRSPSGRRPHIPSSQAPAPLQFPAPVMRGRRRGRRSRRAMKRLAARCRAQEASSGKRASKAARDMGRSYFQRLAMTEHYTNMLPTPTRNSTSRQTGLQSPISLSFQSACSPQGAHSSAGLVVAISLVRRTSGRWKTVVGHGGCDTLVVRE